MRMIAGKYIVTEISPLYKIIARIRQPVAQIGPLRNYPDKSGFQRNYSSQPLIYRRIDI